MNYDKIVALRVPKDMYLRLLEITKREERKLSDVIRRLLKKGLATGK